MVKRISRRAFTAIMAAGVAAACQKLETSPDSDSQGLSRVASSQAPARAHDSRGRVERMVQKLSTYKSLARDVPFRGSALSSEVARDLFSLDAMVSMHPFSSFTTELPIAKFWVNGEPISSRGLMHSLATKTRGPLKPAEVDSDGNIQAGNLLGSVVLVERGPIPFGEVVDRLSEQGALAVVFYDHRPGLVYGTLLQPSQIPALVISQEAGQMLLSRISVESIEAIVDIGVAPRSFQGLNLTAVCPGESKRRILVSTPADAVRGSMFYGGNVDGLVLIRELVRWCGEQERSHTFEFNVFDGTHSGYFGSRWHMGSVLGNTTDHIDEVVTFDRPGSDLPLRIGATKTLADLLNGSGGQNFNGISVSEGFGVGRGDHDVFAAKGVPFVFAERGVGPVANIERLSRSFDVLSVLLETLDTRVRSSKS